MRKLLDKIRGLLQVKQETVGHHSVQIGHVSGNVTVVTAPKEDTAELATNAIGHVTLTLQEPLATLPFTQSRVLGALVLVDTASHKTSGAVLVN